MLRRYSPDRSEFSSSNEAILKVFDYVKAPFDKLSFLVREATQNALDASSDESYNVNISYGYEAFETDVFSNLLEGFECPVQIDEPIRLEIRDHGRGLDGPISLADDTSAYQPSERGYITLVTDIGKAHAGTINEQSGGAYGHGKTLYYHFGIGLVVYYSRVKTLGTYSERLGMCWVPNSTCTQSGGSSITFWGDVMPNSNQQTRHAATLDLGIIDDVCKSLNIKRFQDEETGTSIAIPWFNHDASDHPADLEGLKTATYISLIRFYTPRVFRDNESYKVNETSVKLREKHFEFDTRQNTLSDQLYWLYKKSSEFLYQWSDRDTSRFDDRYNINVEEISVNFYSTKLILGHLSLLEVNADLNRLREMFPSVFNAGETHISSQVVIAFSRSLGMNVNFWTNEALNLPSLDIGDNKIILGTFTLNHNLSLIDEHGKPIYKKLKGYKNIGTLFRFFETNQHISWWYDGCSTTNEFRVAKLLKASICSTLKRLYIKSNPKKQNVQVVHKASDKIMSRLIKYGFGKRPTILPPLPPPLPPQPHATRKPYKVETVLVDSTEHKLVKELEDLEYSSNMFDIDHRYHYLVLIIDIDQADKIKSISTIPTILGVGNRELWKKSLGDFPLIFKDNLTLSASRGLTFKLKYEEEGPSDCFILSGDETKMYIIYELKDIYLSAKVEVSHKLCDSRG